MRKEGTNRTPETVVQEIRRKTRRRFSAEEKIRIVLEGLRGEESIAMLCRKEGLAPNLYYRWSKEFLEAGKKRVVGDTTREATISGRRRISRRQQQGRAFNTRFFVTGIGAEARRTRVARTSILRTMSPPRRLGWVVSRQVVEIPARLSGVLT